jgi:mannitol-1-phosphate/altronate dehydrogenase
MATACWARYWLAQDEQGQAYDFNDPYTAQLRALVAAARDDGDLLDRLLHFEPVWGTELPRTAGWFDAVQRDFAMIRSQGIQATVSGLAA